MIALRDYQQEALDAIEADYREGITRQLISLPTGTGKTVLFSALAKKMNRKTLILAHREELLKQAIEKIEMICPDASTGIVQAELNDLDAQIVAGSVQTVSREKRLEQIKQQGFSLIIIDEAHHATAESYQRVVKELGFMSDNPDLLLVGVSATPKRSDGEALGKVFQKIVYERSISTMIRAGYLSDLRGIRIQTEIDLKGITVRQGDFATAELSAVVNTVDRNKLIVDSRYEHASELQSVAFCVDVKPSQYLAQEFKARGIRAEAVWGDMSAEKRAEVLQGFADGSIQVITNCAVLTEGWDAPQIGCVLMCRPTKSQSLYIQCVGRGTRLYPNKKECLVLDFADSRHDVCQLGTLTGKSVMKHNQSIIEALDEDEQAKVEATAKAGTMRAIAFDLLNRSKFNWFEIAGIGWKLPIAPNVYVILNQVEPDKYKIKLYDNGEPVKELSKQMLPLSYGQGIAEDYARGMGNFSTKDAYWRTLPATEKQIDMLQRLNIIPAPNISRGEVSDIIESRKGLPTREPATGKQLYFLKCQGVKVKPDMSKQEASQMISKLKENATA